jgi:DNA-binding response OmpR family regulator
VAVLLLIEDDLRIRTALTRAMTDRGHAVSSEPAGMRGLQRVLDDPPDLVVLDLGLPDVDGTAVLRMLRGVSRVPVVVATARDDEAEIVAVLDAGADDYVVKPFSAAQLDARIRAVLRCGGEAPPDEVAVGGLRIDPRSR